MLNNYAGFGASSNQAMSILDMQKMQDEAVKETKPADWLDLGMDILERENTLFSGIKEERRKAEADGIPDPEFSVGDDDVKKMTELQLSDVEADYLRRANSRESFDARVRFIQEDRDHKKMLDQAGFAGTAATVAAGIFDPLTMPLETLSGYAIAAKSASILSGALKAGALAAASNAATELVLSQSDTQRSGEDVLYAAIGGMALGGLLGGVTAKLAGTVSPDNGIDELMGAYSKVDDVKLHDDMGSVSESLDDAIIAEQPILGLPAPRIAGYLVDKSAVEDLANKEIKLLGLKPVALLESQDAINARTTLDLDNIAASEVQVAVHQAELAKAQAELNDLTKNPNYLSDVAIHSKLREGLTTDIEAAKGLTTAERLTERMQRIEAEIASAKEAIVAHGKKPVRDVKSEVAFKAERDATITAKTKEIDAANAELKSIADEVESLERVRKVSESVKKAEEDLKPLSADVSKAKRELDKAKAVVQKGLVPKVLDALATRRTKLAAAEAVKKKYLGRYRAGKLTDKEKSSYLKSIRDIKNHTKAISDIEKLQAKTNTAENQAKIAKATRAHADAVSKETAAKTKRDALVKESEALTKATEGKGEKIKSRTNAAQRKIADAQKAIDTAKAEKATDFDAKFKEARAEYARKKAELYRKKDELVSSSSKVKEELNLKDKAARAHAQDKMLREGKVPEELQEVFEKLKSEHQGYAIGYREYQMKILADRIDRLTTRIANHERYIDAITERVERATRPFDEPWIVSDSVKIIGKDYSTAVKKPVGVAPPKVGKKFRSEKLSPDEPPKRGGRKAKGKPEPEVKPEPKPKTKEEIKEEADLDAKIKEEILGDGTPEKPPLNDIDQNSADLYNTERLSILNEVRKTILEYASMVSPALGKGGAIGSRLSRSKILAMRGLSAMIASMPQGGVSRPCAAAVAAKNLGQVLNTHTPAVEAVQSAMRKVGYNAFTINSEAGQEFMDALNDNIVRYITTGVKPQGAYAEEIIKAGDSCRAVFRESLHMRKESGVRGFEHIEGSDEYFPLSFLYRKMQSMIDRMGAGGRDTVHSFISDAYLNGKVLSKMKNRAKARDVADLLAGAQMERTLSKTDQATFQNKMHQYFNAGTVSFLKKSMREAGVPEVEVDVWLDAMHKVDQQMHVSDRAKASFGADLTYARDGMRMTDFIDTDIEVAARYGREAAADAGMATSGIRSRADYGNIKEDIAITTKADLDKKVEEGSMTPHERERQMDRMQEEFNMLDDVVKTIYGRDLDADEFGKVSKLVKAGRATRALASAAMLAFNGLTTSVEFGRVMAQFGFFNTIKELKHFKIRPSNFKNNDEYWGEWAKVFGAYGHAEGWYYGTARSSNIVSNFDQLGGKMDVFLRGTREVAGFASFFKHVQHGLEEIGMRLQMNQLEKLAMKTGDPSFRVPKDLYDEFARHGMSPSEVDNALAFMRGNRKSVKVDGKAFDVTDIDKMPYDMRNKLGATMLYVMNRVVQRQMAGDEMPLMMRETGKFLLQFMSYPLAAIEKQLIYGMRFSKAKTVAATLFSFGLGYLQFGGRTWIGAQNSDDPDAYWEEAMKPRNAITAAALSTGALGSTVGLSMNALATAGLVPDELLSRPLTQGASTMAKAPAAAAYAIGAVQQPAKFMGHAYDAFNDELDYEQLNKDFASMTRYIPVVNSAMFRLGTAVINKSREEL